MRAKRILTTLMMALVLVATGTPVQATDMPEQVTLDSLVKLFNGAEFDHDMHSELGEDCSACHHHTTGTGTTDDRCIRCHANSDGVEMVGCRDCHVQDPFSAESIKRQALDRYQFHIDTPGLKGAYHWKCIGCHEEMDGPTDCEGCHTRTSEGDTFYHKDAAGAASYESGH